MTGHGSYLYEDLDEISTLDGDLRIGEFLVRPLLKQVVRIDEDGSPVEEHSLPDKAMGVLVYLAESSRLVCERDDILEAVWGADREALDRVLDTAIGEIRRVLGDDARDPSYVQTVPKRGYRLLVSVTGSVIGSVTGPTATEGLENAELPSLADPSLPEASRWNWMPWALGLFLAACAAIAWMVREPVRSEFRVGFGSSQTPVAPLLDVIRRGVLEEHPCTDESLLGPARRLRRPDFTVKITTDDAALGRSEITVTSSHADWKETHFAADPQDTTSLAAARDVRLTLDEAVCRSDHPEPGGVACHCLSAGSVLAASQRPQAAAQLLERAVQLEADLLPAYEALIPALLKLGESERVVSTLRYGLQRLGSLDSPIALQLRRRLAQVQNDHATEWQMIQTLAEQDPESPKVLIDQASFLIQHRSDFEAALAILEPLSRQRPDDLRVQFMKANANLRGGRVAEGVDTLEQLVATSNRSTEVRLWLGVVYQGMGRWDEATDLAYENLTLDPENPLSYWLLGAIARSKGKYSESLHWADRTEEFATWPQDRLLVSDLRASAARYSGDFEACLRLTEAYQEPSPGLWGYPLLFERGLCLLDAGKIDSARRLLADWQAQHYPRASSWEEWLLLVFQGSLAVRTAATQADIEAAVEVFEEACRLAGFQPSNPYLAGAELDRAGYFELARPFYERALASNPRHPWTHCRLGLASRESGETKRAIDHFRLAIEVFGDPPEDPLGMECAEALAELDPTFRS